MSEANDTTPGTGGGVDPAEATAPAAGGLSRKWTFGILALCFLFVLMPYLFWQGTWFGKPLTDAEIGKNLADTETPRKTQHALAQIADSIIRKEAAVKRWYPQVIALASHKVDEIRITVAWVMGQDNSVPQFHQALLSLLRDPNPMVRRNAALGLVRFQDASGHEEIVAMLSPYTMPAPFAGALNHRLKPGDALNPGTLLGRIQTGSEEKEVRSQVPGTLSRWLVAENSVVQVGQGIAEIEPDTAMVWEALRALVFVGTVADLPAVERFTLPRANQPEQIRSQARETMLAIRKHAEAQL